MCIICAVPHTKGEWDAYHAVCLIVLHAVCAAAAFAKKTQPPTKVLPFSEPTNESAPPELVNSSSPIQSAAATDTFELAFYDFEGSNPPDPQGWIPFDRTAQIDEFFHVANGTELDGGSFGTLLPLEGFY